MTGPLIRIALRYLAGIGFGGAAVASVLSDPEFSEVAVMGFSILASLAVEVWYYLARKFGWSK